MRYPQPDTIVTIEAVTSEGTLKSSTPARVLAVRRKEGEITLQVTDGTRDVPAGECTWFRDGMIARGDGKPGTYARLTFEKRKPLSWACQTVVLDTA